MKPFYSARSEIQHYLPYKMEPSYSNLPPEVRLSIQHYLLQRYYTASKLISKSHYVSETDAYFKEKYENKQVQDLIYDCDIDGINYILAHKPFNKTNLVDYVRWAAKEGCVNIIRRLIEYNKEKKLISLNSLYDDIVKYAYVQTLFKLVPNADNALLLKILHAYITDTDYDILNAQLPDAKKYVDIMFSRYKDDVYRTILEDASTASIDILERVIATGQYTRTDIENAAAILDERMEDFGEFRPEEYEENLDYLRSLV